MSNRFPVAAACAVALALAVVLALVPAASNAATPATGSKLKPAAKAPAPTPTPTIATILGHKITKADFGPVPTPIASMAKGDPAKLKALRADWENQALTGLVLGAMLDRYGAQHEITPTPREISQVLAVMAKPDPTEIGIKRAPPDTTDAQVRGAGAAVVGRFKIHAALYRQYGGRVLIDRQSGPLPFDSYRKLLEAEEKAGTFTVATAWKTRFWRPFAEDSSRTFVPQAEAMATMTNPWWLAPDGSTTR